MIINLQDAILYADVNAAFSSAFPGLRLVFFSEPQSPGAASSLATQLEPDANLPALVKEKPALIELDASMTTAAAEQLFRDSAGLFVQVCRKNGSDWIVTSSSDSDTLDEQNRRGLLSTDEWMSEKEDEDDRVL
jgi:hypothetical protein